MESLKEQQGLCSVSFPQPSYLSVGKHAPAALFKGQKRQLKFVVFVEVTRERFHDEMSAHKRKFIPSCNWRIACLCPEN